MKQIYKNITDIDNGSLIEQANLDFSKIMASINDLNTDKRKAAKLVIEIQIKAHEDDDFADVQYKVKATPLPIKPRKITLLNTSAQVPGTGEVVPVLREFTGEAPGQISIYGDINEPQEIMYGAGNIENGNEEENK